MYSPDQLAEKLERSPKTIRAQLRRGTIKGTKKDGRWLISPIEAERIMKDRARR